MASVSYYWVLSRLVVATEWSWWVAVLLGLTSFYGQTLPLLIEDFGLMCSNKHITGLCIRRN